MKPRKVDNYISDLPQRGTVSNILWPEYLLLCHGSYLFGTRIMNILCTVFPQTSLFYPEVLIESKAVPPFLHHLFRHLWIHQCHFSFSKVKYNLEYQKVTVSLFLFCCFSQLCEAQHSCFLLYPISFLCLSMLKSTLLSKETWPCPRN